MTLRERLDRLVEKYTYRNAVVEWTDDKVMLPDGRVSDGATLWYKGVDTPRVVVPRVRDERTFVLYVHEMAHAALGHRGENPAEAERQAELVSYMVAMAEGLHLPKGWERRARFYVLSKALETKTDTPEIVAFCFGAHLNMNAPLDFDADLLKRFLDALDQAAFDGRRLVGQAA